MKILVLGSRVPWPLRDGGALATYHMLKGLASAGVSVTFFSYNTRKHFVTDDVIQTNFDFCKVITSNLDASVSVLGAMAALISGKNYNISRFESEAGVNKLKKVLESENFDLVHVEGLYAAPLMKALTHTAIPAVLRQHNVEFEIWEKLANPQKNPVSKWYMKKLAAGLKKYEINTLKTFHNILAISPSDLMEFQKINPTAFHMFFPAGIELPELGNSTFQKYNFCHIGSMEWLPNVEGVSWFIDSIWPEILKKYPQAKFHIAGKGLNKNDPRFLGLNVVNHGEVDNAGAFLRQHGIMVVPLHAASGIRMKTIEAMGLGVPVISTFIGTSGLEISNKNCLRVANDLQEWLSAATAFTEDDQAREEVTANAREFVSQNFGNAALIPKLIAYYQKILSAH